MYISYSMQDTLWAKWVLYELRNMSPQGQAKHWPSEAPGAVGAFEGALESGQLRREGIIVIVSRAFYNTPAGEAISRAFSNGQFATIPWFLVHVGSADEKLPEGAEPTVRTGANVVLSGLDEDLARGALHRAWTLALPSWISKAPPSPFQGSS